MSYEAKRLVAPEERLRRVETHHPEAVRHHEDETSVSLGIANNEEPTANACSCVEGGDGAEDDGALAKRF